jgi:GntR family transcriptional regulator, transcriptional repressor for pyruvate dehydrogenase complex
MEGIEDVNTGSYPSRLPYLKLSDNLKNQTIELIRSTDLRPGDRLPSVRALAEQFSVSIPTMREALRRLQASGVIEIQHGSGIYLRSGRERIMLSNPVYGELELESIPQLLEARLLIEPRIAELAAQEASAAEVDELDAILSEAERYLSGNNDAMLHRVNMGFHRAIANFSGNYVLAQIIESLTELYSYQQLAIISLYNDRPGDHDEHRAIFAAIRARKPARARELMRRHVSNVKSIVEASLAESGSAGAASQG